MVQTRFRLFAGVAPGLEHLLTAELAEIVRGVTWRRTEGGAEGLVAREQLWDVAHRSRVAELLRVRIGEFPATNFSHLMAKLERLPWSAYIRRGLPNLPVVSTVSSKSKLIHAG
jgi:23S rRNA G2445 N2-methylase RlmL